MKLNKVQLGVLVTIILIIVERYFFYSYLNFDSLYRESMVNEGLTESQVDDTFSYQSWIIPIVFLVQLLGVFFTAAFLYMGVKLLNYKVSFKKLVGINFIAYSLIVIGKLVDFIWLKLNIEKVTEYDFLKDFKSLSLQNLYNYNAINYSTFKVFGEINLFRVLFWVFLTFLLSRVLKVKFWKSFEVVLYFNITLFFLINLTKLLLTLNFDS
ncbi:hypothetical protein [Tenacibaculum ovolyticum]|uniref:hypothetical protein n=1 Tax=Tenacibaculum ovolyticum TaxID=104270 RepID=UPI0007ED5C67|nr:hypothetical protein [Tenacibaculum ovolyticum]